MRGWVAVAMLAAVCFTVLNGLSCGLKNVRLNLFLAFKCVKEPCNLFFHFCQVKDETDALKTYAFYKEEFLFFGCASLETKIKDK